MSRESKLVKNTAILSLGTFLPKFASIVTLPILTGYLTKAEYGTFDLVSVLVSLLLPAATLQIQTAAFRYLIDKRGDREVTCGIITNIFAFILPVSVIALVILYLILPVKFEAVKIYMCLYFMVDILVNAARQIARGLGETLNYSICSIISAVGKLIFVYFFVAVLGMGFPGAVLSLFCASAISLIFIVVRMNLFSYIRPEAFNKSELSDMLAYSWPMVPNSMSMWVMRMSDRFVVTAIMGVSSNAVYAVANKIPSLLNLAQSAFTMAWQENASIVSRDEDASAYYSAIFQRLFDLMAGFLGLLICTTPLLFRLLIRGDYSEAYNQMPVLFLATFLYSMATFLGGIYVAYMKTKSVGITTIAAAACNLIVDIALIRRIGLYAASGSTLVSYLFLLIYRMIDIRKIVRIEYNYKRISIISLILISESALCFQRNTKTDIINIGLGVIAFILFNREFIQIVFRKLKGKFKRKKVSRKR